MKVYELISLLGEMKANEDVKVSFTMTTEELKQYPGIGDDTYYVMLDVSGVLDDEATLEVKM